MTEEFLAQYYSAVPAVPRLVVVGPGAARAAPTCSPRRSLARRGGPVEVRVAERGDKRRLRELAERNARLALAQDKLRQERRRAAAGRRARRRCRTRSSSTRCRCGSRASTSPTSAAEHTVASMVVFEGGAPKKADYRRFKSGDRRRRPGRPRRAEAAGPDDFASMEEVLGAARRAAARAGRPLAARPRARRELRRAPRPDRDRRRQGPALGGDARARAAGRARDGRDRAREAARGGLRARALRAAAIPRDSEALRLLQRVRDEAHRFALDHHRSAAARR